MQYVKHCIHYIHIIKLQVMIMPELTNTVTCFFTGAPATRLVWHRMSRSGFQGPCMNERANYVTSWICGTTHHNPWQCIYSVTAFFARPFCLWLPYRSMRVVLHCPSPGCQEKRLTACGLYKTIRKVLDVDGYFHLGTECTWAARRRWQPGLLRSFAGFQLANGCFSQLCQSAVDSWE